MGGDHLRTLRHIPDAEKNDILPNACNMVRDPSTLWKRGLQSPSSPGASNQICRSSWVTIRIFKLKGDAYLLSEEHGNQVQGRVVGQESFESNPST
jgi:hypothetical protein